MELVPPGCDYSVGARGRFRYICAGRVVKTPVTWGCETVMNQLECSGLGVSQGDLLFLPRLRDFAIVSLRHRAMRAATSPSKGVARAGFAAVALPVQTIEQDGRWVLHRPPKRNITSPTQLTVASPRGGPRTKNTQIAPGSTADARRRRFGASSPLFFPKKPPTIARRVHHLLHQDLLHRICAEEQALL